MTQSTVEEMRKYFICKRVNISWGWEGNSRKLRWLCLMGFTSLWYGKLDAKRMQKGGLNIWASQQSSRGNLEGLPEAIIHTFRTKLICLGLIFYSAKLSSQVLGQKRNVTGLSLFLCLVDLEIVPWEDLITRIWDPWQTIILYNFMGYRLKEKEWNTMERCWLGKNMESWRTGHVSDSKNTWREGKEGDSSSGRIRSCDNGADIGLKLFFQESYDQPRQ